MVLLRGIFMKKMFFLVLSFLLSVCLFGCKSDEKPIVSEKQIVSFECNGGDLIEEIEVEKGKTIPLPDPKREGFFFKGWYSDLELTIPFEENTIVDQDLTLYAKWMDQVQAFYEAVCDYLEKLNELSGIETEILSSYSTGDSPFLRLAVPELLPENQYDQEYFADVYDDQKDNSNSIEIYEDLYPYKLVLDDIKDILESETEIAMDTYIEIEAPGNQLVRYRFSILEDEYILIFSEVVWEGGHVEETNLKMGFNGNGDFDLKEYIFNSNYPDSFHYFEFVETDQALHLMYLEDGSYHYDYRSETNNEYYAFNFDPADLTFDLEDDYSIQWYSDETHVRSSIHFSNDIPVSEFYEVFNEKGVVFYYRNPSLNTKNAISLTWNMLETTGWDFAYVENIESHSRGELDGIYKNGLELFPDSHLGVYKNDLFAHLTINQDFLESEVTDGLLTLADYGLVFYGNRINLAYISNMRTRAQTEVQTLKVYDGVDMLGADIRASLVGKIDPDLIPNFDEPTE